MANHPAPPLLITDDDRGTLTTWSRSRALPQRLVLRARIVLLAAEGMPNRQIAAKTATSQPTVQLWRSRYASGGIAALELDQPGRGRPKRHGEEIATKIISVTLGKPPRGMTHWSTRLVAEQVGVGSTTVHRIWREHGLQPHRTRSFKYSTDPKLETKVTDVIGLYLHPPEKALVLCVDEKSQIQALDRTQPLLPMRPGQPERRTHDYVRHGTATLFAAFDIASGSVTGRTYARHRHQEFLKFLQVINERYPGVDHHDLIHEHQRKRWSDGTQDEADMTKVLSGHVGREPVEQAAQRRGHDPGDPSANHEVRDERSERQAQRDYQVVRDRRAEGQCHRPEHGAHRDRVRVRPEQVQPHRTVHVGGNQRIETVPGSERHPSDSPHRLDGVRSFADVGGRRRAPDRDREQECKDDIDGGHHQCGGDAPLQPCHRRRAEVIQRFVATSRTIRMKSSTASGSIASATATNGVTSNTEYTTSAVR